MNYMNSALKIFTILGLLIAQNAVMAFRPISVDPDTSVALGGFDVVSYHLAEAPVKGHPSYQIEWSGAQWRFASQTHMRLFKKSPQKYAPEFGGYCAFGMSAGGKEVHACNPTVYTLQKGRLIVFSSQAQLDAWMKNPEESHRVGTDTYKALLSESTQVAPAAPAKASQG